jgi:flavin reductase (DIM6/NTAB) family NADH-FMN oxidoreductase RutF
MAKSELPPSTALFPVPVVIVSCIDRARNRPSAITIAWCGNVCSEPPCLSVSIRPSRHSHALISAEKEFCVNIPPQTMLRETDLCGIISGRDTDKFAACAFTPVKASKISAPMIKECPVNIECRLKNTLRLGTHDIFIAEAVAVHVDDQILGADGRIDVSKSLAIAFCQHQYWSLGKMIGHHGFSKG